MGFLAPADRRRRRVYHGRYPLASIFRRRMRLGSLGRRGARPPTPSPPPLPGLAPRQRGPVPSGAQGQPAALGRSGPRWPSWRV